jgi:O-antigen ligase
MKASWLWLGILPLLYLPNFISADTGAGQLETCDFLILPFFLVVLLLPRKTVKNTYAKFIIIPGLGFLMWCLFGALMIFIVYDIQNVGTVVAFSLLKIGKFALYTITPLSIARRLVNSGLREDYMWALATCGIFLGLGVLTETALFRGTSPKDKLIAFKALNLVSVSMAVLLVYLLAFLLSGGGSAQWRNYCKISLAVLGFGFTYTDGRGGWFAAASGIVYMAYHRGFLRRRTLSFLILSVVAAVSFYFINPEFQRSVTHTFFPEAQYGGQYAILPIDDGNRLIELNAALKNFSANLILGAGFYHRGAEVGLYRTSTHNFWIQMLFETGIVGFALLMTMFLRIWRHTNSNIGEAQKYSLATRSVLVTTFIGGLSGDYFYGGLALLSVMLCYAPLGSMSPTAKYEQA